MPGAQTASQDPLKRVIPGCYDVLCQPRSGPTDPQLGKAWYPHGSLISPRPRRSGSTLGQPLRSVGCRMLVAPLSSCGSQPESGAVAVHISTITSFGYPWNVNTNEQQRVRSGSPTAICFTWWILAAPSSTECKLRPCEIGWIPYQHFGHWRSIKVGMAYN